MLSTRRRTALALALLVGLPAAGWAAPDQVTTTSRKVLQGKILADQYDKLIIQKQPGNAKVELKMEEVASVRYGDKSMNYLNATNLMKQERYAEALPKFDAAIAEASKIKWLGQYAQFNKAECLANLAASDAKRRASAIGAYKELIAKYPKSRFLPNAYIGLAKIYQEAGDVAKMAAAVKQLDPGKLGQQWAMQRQLWDARVLEAKKQFALAAKEYGALAAAAEKAKDTDMNSEALASEGRCMLLAGQYDAGEKILYQLAKQVDDAATKAQVYNALGDSFWKRGEVHEALFCYLRVAVLYFDVPDEHPKAMYWAAKCFAKRGDPQRAKELLAELKREYPDSPWSKKK